MFEIIAGGTIPVLFFLIFWWGSVLLTDNITMVAAASLAGLVLGLMLALLVRWYWKMDVFELRPGILMAIYIFYSLCMFGFFMGVPLLHPVLGLLAGAYWATRMIGSDVPPQDHPASIKRVASFTAMVMGGICCLSAFFALNSESTPSDMQGMLELPFTVTQPMIIALIIAGGAFLVVLQYWLTKMIMTRILTA